MDSLSKYIAQSGAASRRMATELIKEGKVMVNGVVVKEPGHKLEPGAVVKVGKKTIVHQKKVYIAMNKPKGYITTVSDDKNRQTVMQLLVGAPKVRLYPIGRLDQDTTGILLFTNDGDFAQKLAHPKFEVVKEYIVTLDRDFSDADRELLSKTIHLKDGAVKVDHFAIIHPRKKNVLKIKIHSGKNRVVRRIFAHLGYFVNALERVSFGGLSKRAIPIGRWRYLTSSEVRRLIGSQASPAHGSSAKGQEVSSKADKQPKKATKARVRTKKVTGGRRKPASRLR